MTAPTTADLLSRLRSNPELMEELRLALNKEAGYDKHTITPQYKKTLRDAEIAAKVHAGATHAKVAIEYQLSLPRIAQIMRMHPNPNPDGKVNPNLERDQAIAKKIWEGVARRDVAAEYGLSMARIHQIAAQYPNPNPVRVNPNAERNRLILDEARKKVPRAVIAQKYGLSLIRINQIVGAEPKPKKMTYGERVAEAMRKYDAWEDLTFDEECLIMVTKYEPLARKITQEIVEGATPQVMLQWGYPADCTGNDIAWTPEHYKAIASMMYDFNVGLWKR
jgi:hypothetical protein